MNKKWILNSFLMAACLSPLAAQAKITWSFADTYCTDPASCGTNWNPQRTYEASSVTAPDTAPTADLTASSWYMNTSDGSGSNNTLTKGVVHDSGSSSGLIAARDDSYYWTQSPRHAIGNVNGDLESVLFDFGTGNVVALQELTIGWPTSGEGDLAILAYTAASGAPNLVGNTYADLVAPGGGWEIVTKINNAPDNDPNYFNGTGTVESRYWMVAAANTQLAAVDPANPGGWDFGDDAFKIKSVAGSGGGGGTPPGSVPEPGALLLLGMGLPLLRLAAKKKLAA